MSPNRRPGNTSALLLIAAAGLAIGAAPAFAQIHWNNTGGGLWSNATNWTPNNVPDNTGEAAVIDAAGSYLVQIDNSYQVASLSIPVATAQVGLLDARELQVVSSVAVDGVLRINQNAGGNGTGLRLIGGNLSLTGTGALVLNASSNIDTAYITTNNGGWILTNGAIIRGTGRVHTNVTNNNLLTADVSGATLQLLNQPKTNNATFSATGGGVLNINCPVTQGPSGQIVASGGTVQLSSATITDGRVSTVSGATQIVASSTFHNVTTSGVIDVLDARELATGLVLTNNGTINVNDAGGNGTGLRLVSGDTALSGTGTVVLRASSNLDTAYITSNNGGWLLTQAPTHTIRGTGRVWVNLINNGNVTADQSAKVLYLGSQPKANNSFFTATGGGVLDINCGVTQGAAGQIRANGGTVRYYSASVAGGQLTGQSGGTHQIHSTTTFDGVTSSATIQQLDSTTAYVNAGGFVNNGTWTINQTAGGNGTTINLGAGNASITGTGSIILNASGNRDTATMYASNGGWILTHGPSHTIRGTGRIHVNLINDGVVQADSPGNLLELLTQPKLNNNIFRATATGVLGIGTQVTQGVNGRIIADNGEVQLYNANIIGGRLDSANNGRVEIWGTTTFTGITNNAPVDLHDARGLYLPVEGFVNNNVITINEEAGGNGTFLNLSNGNGILSGTGQVVLNAGLNRDTATIYANNGGWMLTQTAGHSLRGTGRIHVNLANHGVVEADRAGRYLELLTQPKANHNIFRASGGGLLGIGTSVAQTAAGRIIADNSVVQFYNASVTGGTVESVGAGRVEITATTTFDGVTLSAPTDIFDAQHLQVPPGGFANNGYITVNRQAGGNGTTLRLINGNATVSGTGTVFLNASSNFDTATLATNNGGWTMTLGPGQTLAGNGRLHTMVALQGTISPGASAGRIEPRLPFSMTPTATARIEIGGTAAGTYDTIGASNSVTVDGSLRVSLINGFTGGIGQEWTVISGSSVSGEFDQLVLPAPPVQGLKWAVQYLPNAVIVRVTCNADFNNDGQVDFFDYLDFVAALADELPEADYNGDNQVDFFDYLDFVAEVDSGCA